MLAYMTGATDCAAPKVGVIAPTAVQHRYYQGFMRPGRQNYYRKLIGFIADFILDSLLILVALHV